MWIVLLLLLVPGVAVAMRQRAALVPLLLGDLALWVLMRWLWMPNLQSPFGWLGYAWALVWGGAWALLVGMAAGTASPLARPLAELAGASVALGTGLLVLLVTALGAGWLVPLASMNVVAASGRIHVAAGPLPPLDVHQLNIVPPTTAYQAMRNAVGAYGAQYHVSAEQVYEVRIAGKQVYVAPLIWNTLFVWMQTAGLSPGYMELSATNPAATPQFVRRPFRFATQGVPLYARQNVRRALWMHGYRQWVLRDSWDSFEIAPDGTPFWVVSAAVPTDGMAGLRVVRVLLLNAVTGQIRSLPLGPHLPLWINQAIPRRIATRWAEWWGKYRHGWWTASPLGSHIGVYQPVVVGATGTGIGGQATFGVMGPGGDLYWYTGLTSISSTDSSLVGYTMVDARTGHAEFYREAPGMMNGEAVIQKVNGAFPNVQLVGAMPLFTDLYGKEIFVVPVVNGSAKLQDFAIVDPRAPNAPVLTAPTWTSALSTLQQYLASSQAGAVSASAGVRRVTVSGRIARIGPYGGGQYLFTLKGHRHFFLLSATSVPAVALAQPGDPVRVTYLLTPGNAPGAPVPVTRFSDPAVLGTLATIHQMSQTSVRIHSR